MVCCSRSGWYNDEWWPGFDANWSNHFRHIKRNLWLWDYFFRFDICVKIDLQPIWSVWRFGESERGKCLLTFPSVNVNERTLIGVSSRPLGKCSRCRKTHDRFNEFLIEYLHLRRVKLEQWNASVSPIKWPTMKIFISSWMEFEFHSFLFPDAVK